MSGRINANPREEVHVSFTIVMATKDLASMVMLICKRLLAKLVVLPFEQTGSDPSRHQATPFVFS